MGEFTFVNAERFAYSATSGFGAPPLAGGSVPAGLKMRGQVLFDVTEGASLAELRWDRAAGTLSIPMATIVEP